MEATNSSTRALQPGRVTVFAHVHYPDIWSGMSEVLAARLTVPFRLIITTTAVGAPLALPETALLEDCEVLEVENRGRDILPFLTALGRAGDVEIGLKIHTKRSPQREDGDLWRESVLRELLPADEGVQRLLGHLVEDQRVGLVTPGGFTLAVGKWIGINRAMLDRLIALLSIEQVDLDDCFFSAGSMFWFRREAISNLTAPVVLDAFEAEEGQLDATAAHAMERLFPVVARSRGFLSLASPALLASRPTMSRAELLELAREHADVPSTFFPAPNVPALPPTAEGMREALAIHKAVRGAPGEVSLPPASPSLRTRARGLIGRMLRRC